MLSGKGSCGKFIVVPHEFASNARKSQIPKKAHKSNKRTCPLSDCKANKTRALSRVYTLPHTQTQVYPYTCRCVYVCVWIERLSIFAQFRQARICAELGWKANKKFQSNQKLIVPAFSFTLSLSLSLSLVLVCLPSCSDWQLYFYGLALVIANCKSKTPSHTLPLNLAFNCR